MSPKVWYIPSKRTEPGKNVGIYCRVSSGEKNQLYSLSAQISALTKAVANVDQWKLTDVFIDIASAFGLLSFEGFREVESLVMLSNRTVTVVSMSGNEDKH